ncbi:MULTISPECIES: DUF7683 domain-containing protein [unclassified Mycobacterium]|uniref:DUF7683 domain-containing protein n=1 Tax=Mycobacterium sp. DL99 TaxID=2528957 RepID=UPI001080023B|nr:hypothetical protein [Mycobacterium sp. DL99]
MPLQWVLEGFHPDTEQLVHDYPLPRLTPAAIRQILNVPEDIPIEPFSFDIPDDRSLHALAEFAGAPVTLDPTFTYQLGCYSE